MTNESIINQLKWRYAVKQFDPTKKVSAENIHALEQSLILAPTSYGLQQLKFLVITDEKLRAELRPHAWEQSQVTDASHLIIIAAKTEITEADIDRYVERIIEVRGTPREMLSDLIGMMKGFRKRAEDEGWMQVWTAKQSYIALGFLMETAAMLGVDACPMEGFVPQEFDRVLGLDNENYTTAVLCPVGYRAETDWLANLPKVRFEENDLIRRI